MSSAHEPLSPATDPRIDPRLRAALATYGLDGPAAAAPFDRTAPVASVDEFVGGADAGFNQLYDVLPLDLPGDVAVECTATTITGLDGNELTIRTYRRSDVRSAPGVMYIHGGGMTILRTDAPVHNRWCEALAAAGVIAVQADFRNAWSAAGRNPYPAGLDDCAVCLDWVHAHRAELGITELVVQGESGGANLTLATALRAAREGRLDRIDGVYGSVPYISGGYGWPAERRAAELPSMVENNGLFLDCSMMDLLVAVYQPDEADAENPLCWPYFASVDELRGLPPHVISVNELDPLRDEGIAYYRKLLGAGVDVAGRMNLGITHGAELIFRTAIPDVHRDAIADIVAFAHRVCGCDEIGLTPPARTRQCRPVARSALTQRWSWIRRRGCARRRRGGRRPHGSRDGGRPRR